MANLVFVHHFTRDEVNLVIRTLYDLCARREKVQLALYGRSSLMLEDFVTFRKRKIHSEITFDESHSSTA